MEHRLQEPFTKEQVEHFKAGDRVLVTGTIYTARDAAHKRIVELLQKGEEPPFDIENSIVYYVGPTPVSYTHLDVYKRQTLCSSRSFWTADHSKSSR